MLEPKPLIYMMMRFTSMVQGILLGRGCIDGSYCKSKRRIINFEIYV